ncbi:MAG: DUF2500 domain-containing protein [Clostridiales bacterium]|jgi:hypothetical protein|nr:DUF2500 domain-containing protein [Clostridiales bacterium]
MYKNKKSKKPLIVGIIFVVLISIVSAFPYIVSMIDRSEQVEQVEVAGKRTEYYSIQELTYYGVTFKFSDGSVKELNAVRLKYYNAIHEGDTGKLTYKEDKRMRYRTFIRFEKDSPFGGVKIEPNRENEIFKMVMAILPPSITVLACLLLLRQSLKKKHLRKNLNTRRERKS